MYLHVHVETQAQSLTQSFSLGWQEEQGKVSTALRIISRDSVCYEKFFFINLTVVVLCSSQIIMPRLCNGNFANRSVAAVCSRKVAAEETYQHQE